MQKMTKFYHAREPEWTVVDASLMRFFGPDYAQCRRRCLAVLSESLADPQESYARGAPRCRQAKPMSPSDCRVIPGEA